MVVPPTTPRRPVAGPEHDVLLATKLHVPRPRQGYISRPRLLAALVDGASCELILVCTPAGFGKTTLLSDWVRQGQRPVAWLSLDEGDNDPVRFWRLVAAALDGVRSGIADRIDPLLSERQPASFEAVVTTLANELAHASGELVLVLDDYHLIQASPIHESLGYLLEHMPACLRMVLASRSDPPLPLARLRARGQLADLRAADLRFTSNEAAKLLRTTVGDLHEAAVAALGERTEGWVAGLQLASLSLRGGGDVDAFVGGFSGSHRYVLDYLTEEVLDRQPVHIREFLLLTSILDRLSGPLCDAVTGRADSQGLLETVERANLFLVPLDDVRGWWRYHHLFADLLRLRLDREMPDEVLGLHRAAAGWLEGHGLVDDAVRHALAAGDAVWAARLIERYFDALLQRGEDATLRHWLSTLPVEVVRSRPRLCLARALWAMIGGRLEAMEPLLTDAEQALAAVGEEPYEPSVGRSTSLVANLPAAIAFLRAGLAKFHGDADATTSFGQQAKAHLTDANGALSLMVEWYLAVADWLRGRLEEAERALTSLVHERGAPHARRYLALRCYDLGEVQRARGRLSAALRTYQMVLDACGPGRPLPPAGMAHVGAAWTLYDRGELDAALEHAIAGVELCRLATEPRPLVAGLAILAWIRRAQGDRIAALDAIAEAEKVGLSPSVVGLLNPGPSIRARLALAYGDLAEAVRWVQARGLDASDPLSYPHERDYLVLARVLLATGASEQALFLLDRLLALAMTEGRTGSLIEVRALRALGLAAAGDRPEALATLADALRLAAPEGHTRIFLDEGAAMANLVGELTRGSRARKSVVDDHILANYLTALRRAFDQAASHHHQRRAADASPGMIEMLTARELEVLGLLAAGRSNLRIAGDLVVTLDTVKKHVSRVLDKLGAANRTEAVARARELGLIP